MGQKRRVLLLGGQSLLGESLERILSQVEDVDLIGPLVLDDQILDQLPEAMPDVVLVAEERRRGESAASLTARILERYPALPVLRVGLAQNVIRVYTSHTLPARSADLIEVIRSLPASHPTEDVENQA